MNIAILPLSVLAAEWKPKLSGPITLMIRATKAVVKDTRCEFKIPVDLDISAFMI
jgi:hypothetical protein